MKSTYFNLYKFKKIMAMYPFKCMVTFEQWLETNNLLYEDFVQFFNKNQKSNHFTDNNPWMDYLLNSYVSAIKPPKHFKKPLGVIIDFIVEKATFDFKHKILKVKNNHKLNIKPSTFKNLFIHELSQLLSSIILPFMNLEFSIACDSKEIMGINSSEQYKNFLNQLSNKKYIVSVYNQYPNLFDRLICIAKETTIDLYLFYRILSKDYYHLYHRYGNLGAFNGFYPNKSDVNDITEKVKICQFDNITLVFSQNTIDSAESSNNLSLKNISYTWEKYIGVDYS